MTIPRDPDRRFMLMALRLAKKGLGRTSPNPAVGAVVVQGDEVVGRGYHERAGGPHAEIHALRNAGKSARGAILYVTLEPCNHFGRTPPCTHAILRAGIARCVIGTLDPNPKVAGGGAKFLKKKGVKVDVGCLELKAKALIAPFVKHCFTGMPWVRVKAASTLDGRIATRTGDSKWITGEKARTFGHRLRAISDAILVGKGTVLADDPSLTCRLKGQKGRDPIRVILDSRLNLPLDRKVFSLESKASTVVFCRRSYLDSRKKEALEAKGVKVIGVRGEGKGFVSMRDALLALGRMDIQSVLVEGGGRIHGTLFDQGLVDEVCFFFAPKVMGGLKAIPSVAGMGPELARDVTRLHHVEVRRLGKDVLIRGYTDEEIFGRCLQG